MSGGLMPVTPGPAGPPGPKPTMDLKGPLAGFALQMMAQQMNPQPRPLPPAPQHLMGLQPMQAGLPQSMRLYQPTPMMRRPPGGGY